MGRLLDETLMKIEEPDRLAMKEAWARLESLTKPRGSLGVLEEIAIKLAGISGKPIQKIRDKVVIVMAGDHGVVVEGVTGYPQEVTLQMVHNFLQGGAGINVLARHVGARVVVVDVGVAGEIQHPSLVSCKLRRGTANIARGPAMSREEAVRALEVGIEITLAEVRKSADEEGIPILATGDMGIGNTTPSSAILAAFSSFPPEKIVGRGTGIDDERLKLKIQAVKRALEVNNPDPRDAIDVVAKVGGLEIAGLAGCILGAASSHVPVVIDGFISGAAALIASRLEAKCLNYMIASHVSAEPGHKVMLKLMGLKPMLHMDMRLGEGTGAALAISLVEAAEKVMAEMATFEDAGVSGAI